MTIIETKNTEMNAIGLKNKLLLTYNQLGKSNLSAKKPSKTEIMKVKTMVPMNAL